MILLLYRLWRRRRDRAATPPSRDVVAAAPRTRDGIPAAARPLHDGDSAAGRGPLALVLHQVRYELIASFRNPRARFFTVVFPILLLVIFASAFGDGTTIVDGVRVPLAQFYVAGIVTLSVINAAYSSLVISVSAARESGVLKRRRATPVPAGTLIAGQALSTLATASAMTAVLLVIAGAAYGVTLSAGALAATACAVVVGTIAFVCVGYAVATVVGSSDAAQPIVQATLLPLYFISGVWIPTDRLPHALQKVAGIFPVEHLASAAHLASVRSSFGAALAPRDLLVLALWALGATVFAARRFSWLPSAAAA